MYYLKCRRVTETENITTATSKTGRLLRRGQSSHAKKTKTQFCFKFNVRYTKKNFKRRSKTYLG